MAQTAPQFDWESARLVDEEPQQPVAAPAPDDTYPGAPLAEQQTATPLSPALFDWESARPVESSQEFDLESAQPLSELAKDSSYIMSRDQRRAYRQEANESDSAVADFLSGIPMLVPGLINISAGTVNETAQQLAQNLYRPDKLLAAFTANVNESQRQNILNYSKLFDYVYRNIRNSDTQRAREGAYGEQIKQQLGAQGKLTGDAFRDQEIVMQELYAAKERGEIPVTDEQRAEDDETDYRDYMRGLAFDQSIANITNVNVSGAPATVPDSRFIGRNIVTGEAVMPGEFSPQALAIGTDPGNILAAGIGSLARVNALRRAGILLGKGLGPTGEALTKAGGAIKRGADAVTERIQLSTGGQRVGERVIGGLSPEMQTYGGGTAAAAVGYMTGGDTPLDQAMTGALALLPAVRMAGGTLRKAGAAANAGWIIAREMDAGAMSAAQVDAAKALGASAAIPERYSRFIQNKGRASADSTLRRVAQDQANPRLLRSLSQFGDNAGLTSAVRATDDAIGGALVGASATAPFALAAPDAEQAGGIVGAGLMFGAVGGVAGGKMTRMAEMQDAMVARMLVDAQASGGNAEAFSRLPHQDLVSLAGLQAFSRGKLTFKPLTTSEYRVNLDVTKRRGENSAGFYVDTADDGTSTVFINMGEPSAAAGVVTKIRPVTKGGKTIEVRDKDGNSTFTYVPNESRIAVKQGDSVGVGTPLTRGTPSRLSVPEEIAHAIFSSKAMDGLPRDEMRNYINQRYKTEGVAARGREYAARIVDQDIAAGVYGAADGIDDAARDRLVEQRFTEFSQASIEDGADPLDWARDEIIAASLRASVQGIDLARLRNQSNFSRLAEQVVASSAQALRVLGVDVDKMGRVLDPAGTFRDNPVFADPAMRRMVTKYMRDYDQWLAGMEDAGRKDKRGVRVAPSGKVEDYANSQHTVLREIKDANGNGTGVFENDVVTRGPDGVVRPKKQSDIDRAEVSRAAQIKSLWDASKTVPTASTEFGKRRVNGRDIVGGPTLPKQFDLFTQFPQWIREFARQLEAGRANGKTHVADYNAIGTGSSGRYRVTNLGNIEAILREVAFVGWQVTKKNHLLATVFDMNAFRAAAKRAIDNGELGEMGNNMDEVNATLLQYLDNHKNGRPGEYGIGQTKKSILNGLIGTGTAKQTAANPFYTELNPRGSVRTFRVDRLNDLRDTGRTGYNFMYEPINANMMPNRMPSALPQAGMAMPDAPANLTTDQIRRELEENQGYLGLSTLGMREGRPVKGGAQQTRELLKRNTALNEELRRRGGPQEESDVERVLRQRGQAMPDVIHDDNYTLSPQVPDRGFYIIGTKPTADGRVLEYHVDPRTTLQPRVAGIDSISGEQVAMLEADRHNTRGDNMGGPLHPFLINNQAVVYLPDGRGYKPVWANMNSGFVTRAKNIVKNTTAGHALIQIMKENAHRSNRKFVMDVTAEIDARRASMSDDQADFLHVLLELGAINPQGRINQACSRVERLSKEVLKKEAELSELSEAQKQYDATFAKYRPMAEFLSRLSPLKNHSTRGRIKEFQGEFGSLVSKYRDEPWYSAMSSKYRNTKFVDEAARFSFKQRGAAMDRITGISFAPDVKKMLDDSMDFVNGKNLDVVGVVQLSKDADAFAVYFGKNAKEESKMSANERLLRDQLLASGTFRPHPSYDWVMLGPENADSFILNAPADPLKLFPDYAKNHPNPKVRGGTKETVAGTMKKSKIPLILK